MNHPQVDGMLRQLRSRDPHAAWAEFLDLYSPLLQAVVREFERDDDAAGDCFLHVCEQLSRDWFRKLRRFRTEGPASFPTWLRAVARNLCLDWHRHEFGRHRVFESIARLPALDQAIFKRIFVDGLSVDEAQLTIAPGFPGLTLDELGQGIARVEHALTPRQRWLLSVRRARHAPGGARRRADEIDDELSRVPSAAPDPESLAALAEERAALAGALSRLPERDRLLIRLRFERDLTLDEIARLLNLGNAQSADRRLRLAIEDLRKALAAPGDASRKSIGPVRVVQAAGNDAAGTYRRDGHE